MPLIEYNARMLAELTRKHDLNGAFCTFGRLYPVQGITFDLARDILAETGHADTGNAVLDAAGGAGDDPIPDEHLLFRALGFDVSESLDALPDEQPTHLCDLNRPTLPDEIYNRFDLVYNNGTLEHVFHVPNMLANMTKMLKVGGVAAHVLPVNNHVGHGFYQFSPNMAFDYYHKNGFDILDSWVIRYENKAAETPRRRWRGDFFKPYEQEDPSALDGRMDAAIYAQVFAARKTDRSTTDRIPQQGEYANSHYARQLPSKMELVQHVQKLSAALMQAKALLQQQR